MQAPSDFSTRPDADAALVTSLEVELIDLVRDGENSINAAEWELMVDMLSRGRYSGATFRGSALALELRRRMKGSRPKPDVRVVDVCFQPSGRVVVDIESYESHQQSRRTRLRV